MKFLKKSIKINVLLLLIILFGAVFYIYNNTENISRLVVDKSFTNHSTDFQSNIIKASAVNLSDNSVEYQGQSYETEGFADLVDFVNPAIVNISAVKVVKSQNLDIPLDSIAPPFRDFFQNILPNEPQEQRFVSIGSGFVVKSDGFIITNNHVVESAEKIQVNFSDGTKFDAIVYATDPRTDIALLKVDATALQTLAFGDSDKVRVGDAVIAVGNPFGLGGTVSSGIISAIGRDIQVGPYGFLQTDAAINRGNSGGPMINMKGEVIGINTAIFSPRNGGGGSIGIGFALPSNLIQNIVSQLVVNKKVTRGYLGIQAQPVSEAIARTLNLPDATGALVATVVEGSPAEEAGLASGDVILSVDNETIDSARTLTMTISRIKPGTEVSLQVIRNKEEINLKVLIAELPEDSLETPVPSEDNQILTEEGEVREHHFENIGIKVVEINDEVRNYFKMQETETGVIILTTKNGSIASQKGLVPGMKIVSVNQEDVNTIEQLTTTIDQHLEQGLLFLLQDLQGNRMFISLTPEEIETGFPEQ